MVSLSFLGSPPPRLGGALPPAWWHQCAAPREPDHNSCRSTKPRLIECADTDPGGVCEGHVHGREQPSWRASTPLLVCRSVGLCLLPASQELSGLCQWLCEARGSSLNPVCPGAASGLRHALGIQLAAALEAGLPGDRVPPVCGCPVQAAVAALLFPKPPGPQVDSGEPG